MSPYAVTKLVNEVYADVFSKVYDLHTVGLRYFNIFGPKQDPHGAYAAVIPLFMQAAIDKKQPTINGDGETRRDFIFVANAVQANVKALLNTEALQQLEAANIACGDCTTPNDLWDGICAAANFNLPAIYDPERSGDVRHSLADISKAKALFGYKPSIQLKEGLAITFNYYQTSA